LAQILTYLCSASTKKLYQVERDCHHNASEKKNANIWLKGSWQQLEMVTSERDGINKSVLDTAWGRDLEVISSERTQWWDYIASVTTLPVPDKTKKF
jgi:hypothetical protein